MSQEERYGTRERVYSAWHRRMSVRRFVGIEKAQLLAMIDVDCAVYVEYDDAGKIPLALIETARDIGQNEKPSTVTANLARLANIPAFTLLYTISDENNPADPTQKDIFSFRVKQIHPKCSGWIKRTPEQWANYLLQIRIKAAAAVDHKLDKLWE